MVANVDISPPHHSPLGTNSSSLTELAFFREIIRIIMADADVNDDLLDYEEEENTEQVRKRLFGS